MTRSLLTALILAATTSVVAAEPTDDAPAPAAAAAESTPAASPETDEPAPATVDDDETDFAGHWRTYLAVTAAWHADRFECAATRQVPAAHVAAR